MAVSASIPLADIAPSLDPALRAVADEAYRGLTASPKRLSPWLFYDEEGSRLFEEITRLPEYYLTRTERALFVEHAEEMLELCGSSLTVLELGAGTAAKTGVLLQALAARQPQVIYQPVDISASALEEARATLTGIRELKVLPVVTNYVTEPVAIERAPGTRVLAMYIGSSIGNFSPAEGRGILSNLRASLEAGDMLLLGTDRAPSGINGDGSKSVSTLLAAYNDAAGVTAEFNRNVLRRLNRDLGANFRPEQFRHCAIWNSAESRIEMHLQSTCAQTVRVPANAAAPALAVRFAAGETIHTENSCKFTAEAVTSLLADSGFQVARTFTDREELFAVTFGRAV